MNDYTGEPFFLVRDLFDIYNKFGKINIAVNFESVFPKPNKENQFLIDLLVACKEAKLNIWCYGDNYSSEHKRNVMKYYNIDPSFIISGVVYKDAHVYVDHRMGIQEVVANLKLLLKKLTKINDKKT